MAAGAGARPATEFFNACRNNDTVNVNKLLNKAQVNPNAAEQRNPLDGFAPLSVAAQHGNATIVAKLLKAKADIEYRVPRTGSAPLMLAVQNVANPGNKPGKLAVVAVLLRHGADVDAVDEAGWTAIMYAAQNGFPLICERLIKADTDVHIENKQQCTALMLASTKEESESAASWDVTALAITEMLLKKGAVNDHGEDALLCAEQNALAAKAAAPEPEPELPEQPAVALTFAAAWSARRRRSTARNWTSRGQGTRCVAHTAGPQGSQGEEVSWSRARHSQLRGLGLAPRKSALGFLLKIERGKARNWVRGFRAACTRLALSVRTSALLLLQLAWRQRAPTPFGIRRRRLSPRPGSRRTRRRLRAAARPP